MNAPDHAEFVPLTEAEVAFARYQVALARWIARHKQTTAADRIDSERRRQRLACPHCNPTAKAMRRVQDQWVVAGIDR